MRIIAGEKRGTKLSAPKTTGIRPTTDRVKESLFGSIQFKLQEAVVLDLFAGSGALGLEAASRGAKRVYLVDNGSEAVSLIKKNIILTGSPQNVDFVRKDFREAIKFFKNNEKFDIVFIDPPYGGAYYGEALDLLDACGVLQNGSTVVLESDEKKDIDHVWFKQSKMRKMGGVYLTYLEYCAGN